MDSKPLLRCGSSDLGFEEAGFEMGLAFDIREDGIASYNATRTGNIRRHVADVASLTLERCLEELSLA